MNLKKKLFFIGLLASILVSCSKQDDKQIGSVTNESKEIKEAGYIKLTIDGNLNFEFGGTKNVDLTSTAITSFDQNAGVPYCFNGNICSFKSNKYYNWY